MRRIQNLALSIFIVFLSIELHGSSMHTRKSVQFALRIWQSSLKWYNNYRNSLNFAWCLTGFIGFPVTLYAARNTKMSRQILEHTKERNQQLEKDVDALRTEVYELKFLFDKRIKNE